jgi:hypothetical protein
MAFDLLTLTPAMRACGNCEHWDGTRICQRNGDADCARGSDGVCLLLTNRYPERNATRARAENPACSEWELCRLSAAASSPPSD